MYMGVYMCVQMYVFMCVYMCAHVCVCTYSIINPNRKSVSVRKKKDIRNLRLKGLMVNT